MHVARVRVCVSASDGSAGHKRRIGQESLLLLFINIIYDVWSEWIFDEFSCVLPVWVFVSTWIGTPNEFMICARDKNYVWIMCLYQLIYQY